jgi:hypothetical protein
MRKEKFTDHSLSCVVEVDVFWRNPLCPIKHGLDSINRITAVNFQGDVTKHGPNTDIDELSERGSRKAKGEMAGSESRSVRYPEFLKRLLAI